MNKNKITLIILTVIICLLIVGTVGLLAYEIATTEEIERRTVTTAILIIISAVISLIKLYTNKKPQRDAAKFYRAEFSEIIGDAFTADKAGEKRFFDGVHEWNKSRFKNALAIFDSVMKEATNTSERFAVLFFSAMCYDDMKIYEKAATLYEQALLVKGNSSAASNLGICYERMGKPEKATEAYERAIYIDPENPYSYNNLAQSLVKQGRFDEAIKWAKDAINRKSNMYQAHSALAVCYAMTDCREEYEAEYRLAVANGANGNMLKDYIKSLMDSELDEEYGEDDGDLE